MQDGECAGVRLKIYVKSAYNVQVFLFLGIDIWDVCVEGRLYGVKIPLTNQLFDLQNDAMTNYGTFFAQKDHKFNFPTSLLIK